MKKGCINNAPEDINESAMVNIGGIDQYISVKGKKSDNPIILFLHGGPGAALSPIASAFPSEYEEHFIVAHWDQRGSGKSYSDNIPAKSMNLDQFVNDTLEVTDYLIKKYNKEKIYLLGLSWGTIPGISAAYLHPEKFYAYIGSGQVVNVKEGEKVSYDFLMETAKKQKNDEAIAELTAIGGPPYKNDEDMMIERKWLREFGFGERSMSKIIEKYSSEDLQVLIKGAEFSSTYLIPQLSDFNIEYIEEMKLPVYFIMGRDDYQTPSIIAEEFYERLKTTKKEFYYFENSAHAPIFEEPEKFLEVLLNLSK